MNNINTIQTISHAELVNFGSGPSAYAFNYSDTGIRGFNFGMTPSSFMLDLALLKKYKMYLKRDCTIALGICPFSFGKNLGYLNPRRHIRYYNVLTQEELQAIPKDILHYDPAISNEINNDYCWFPYGADTNFTDTVMSQEELENKTEGIMNCWRHELTLADFVNADQAILHKSAFDSKRAALELLIFQCLEAGLKPVIVLFPLYSYLRKQMSTEFINAFLYDNLEIIKPQIPILDFTASPQFTDNDFFGSVFLNRSGAAKFTKIIYNITHE